jgi:hypothetical protein
MVIDCRLFLHFGRISAAEPAFSDATCVRSLDRASCVHVKRCQARHERAAKLKMQAMLQVRTAAAECDGRNAKGNVVGEHLLQGLVSQEMEERRKQDLFLQQLQKVLHALHVVSDLF